MMISNNMKNLHKLEFLGLFDNFWVKLKLNFVSETGTYPIKKPTGERLQLLLNRFRVWIHEKVEVFEKLRWEILNWKKVIFVDYFVILVAIFFTKLHLSPQTTLLDNEIVRCWSYSTFWSTKTLEIWQKLLKKVKIWYILKFPSFLVANCAFFLQELLWQRIWSLLNVFNFPGHQGFQKTRRNCIKFSKNLNFLVSLSNPVWVWSIFPEQIAFTSWKKSPDNKLFPCWTSVRF